MENFQPKKELFIKFKCPQIKVYSGNCFTILIILAILSNVGNGFQYLKWMRKAKDKMSSLETTWRLLRFLLISAPLQARVVKCRHLLWVTGTPTPESPLSPRDVSRGKKLFPSSVTKIRKPLFFIINWNTINVFILGRVGATGTDKIYHIYVCMCRL